MCDCSSCKLTDSYADKGFDSWPKGEHIRRSGKDKVYAAHWKHCGAEAHQKRKLDTRSYLGGKIVSAKDYANREEFLIPVPDDDVWVPICEWERTTGRRYIDWYNELKAQNARKAA